MTTDKGIDESKIDPSKNTGQTLDYYKELAALYEADSSATLLKLRSFSVFSPRQVISDFLVRYELFKLIEDVPGSIFEFGVFNGQGLMSFAHFSAILEPTHINRKIVGFDTFEGFIGVHENDKTSRSMFMSDGDYAVSSYERLLKAIHLFDNNRFIGHIPKVELVKGDVSQTLDIYLEKNPHALAAMIYLDMDLYAPTKHALKTMLPRMPKGGIVAFDELNMKDFPGETVALLESLELNKVALKRLTYCSRISYFQI